jgi:hypothetical protein
LEHAGFTVLCVHLGLDDDHLLLAELSLLLDFLQELWNESAYPEQLLYQQNWPSAYQLETWTCWASVCLSCWPCQCLLVLSSRMTEVRHVIARLAARMTRVLAPFWSMDELV